MLPSSCLGESCDADAGDSPDVGTAVSCTADLRTALDVDGAVVETCPLDQGCFEGQCIPACDASARSRGNVGCEFLVSTRPGWAAQKPPCHAVFVTNTWPGPARLSVARGDVTFDTLPFARVVDNTKAEADWAPVPVTGIPEGEVAVLFLSSDPTSIHSENGLPLYCSPRSRSTPAEASPRWRRMRSPPSPWERAS
jgi:hypothetical protein